MAQLTGLFGNALGWRHGDAKLLERLQDRLQFASLELRTGREFVDYQTVELGQDHLVKTGWTTRGAAEERGKGEATRGTHIRLRHYRAGGVILAAIRLEPADEAPTVADLASALTSPVRPLFIGRKSCLPSAPLCVGVERAADFESALRQGLTLLKSKDINAELSGALSAGAWTLERPVHPGEALSARRSSGRVIEWIVDRRDWRNQFHGGERAVMVETLKALPAPPPTTTTDIARQPGEGE
ncbi:CRISPR system Cascade subunit CasD [Azospirillaceae bacterium]